MQNADPSGSAFLALFFLFANAFQLKHMFNRMIEVLRQEQCEREGRHIVAFPHGANCLATDADRFRELLLSNLLLLSEIAKTIIDCMFFGHNVMTKISDIEKMVKGD